jgi:multimeric flavodoxin WrbA
MADSPSENNPPILALAGSPRRRGNTERLLDAVIAAAAEQGVQSEKVMVRNLKISPCLEIYECAKTGHCAINDEMNALYPKLLQAGVIIMASPIFFYGPPAQLKAVIDRCQALWSRKYILKQSPGRPPGKGVLISAAASGGARLFEGLLLTARYFFDTLDIKLEHELLVRGVDEAGAVDDKADVLDQARQLGRDLADFVRHSA